MLQDLSPRQFHAEYHARTPQPQDYLLLYRGDEALVNDETGSFFRVGDVAVAPGSLTYLFSIDDTVFYTSIDELTTEPPHARWISVREFRTYEPLWLAFAGVTGGHITRWYRNHRYCGHCGQRMTHSGHERALRCEPCSLTEYPKISPAVIVAVTDGDRLLLSKYAGRAYANYALIAGFMEVGETLEDTVRREIMEEVGLHVKNLRYYKSQPWSFTDSLLVGFFADLDGSPDITLDESELAVAEWMSADQIPDDSSTISLTRTMINAFCDGDYPR